MDKQLIERIALEKRNALEHETKRNIAAPDWDIQALVTRCLARIDAERGKDAIGYIEKHMLERIKEFGFAHVEVSNINRSSSRVPLFLSQTIPEGMALVPVEATKAMRAAGAAWINSCDSYDAVTIYEAMLAAAQGE